MNFGDYEFGLQFRDTIKRIVRSVLDTERPPSRYATVYSIDLVKRKCSVRYAGDTEDTIVSMGAIQPSRTGQIVRIEGSTGDRYISDVMGEARVLGTSTATSGGTTDSTGGTITPDYANEAPGSLLVWPLPSQANKLLPRPSDRVDIIFEWNLPSYPPEGGGYLIPGVDRWTDTSV